jgi:phage virion morphogenesis protein
MSGVSINLFDQLSPALQRALEAVGDLSQPMADIAGNWLVETRNRFNQQIDPMGVPWAPRKDKDNQKPLLVKDGHLRNQIDSANGPDFAEIGVEETAGPAKYAAIHNYGGTTRPFRENTKRAYGAFAVIVIPKRQFIGASESDQAHAVEVLSDHLKAAFSADAGGEA